MAVSKGEATLPIKSPLCFKRIGYSQNHTWLRQRPHRDCMVGIPPGSGSSNPLDDRWIYYLRRNLTIFRFIWMKISTSLQNRLPRKPAAVLHLPDCRFAKVDFTQISALGSAGNDKCVTHDFPEGCLLRSIKVTKCVPQSGLAGNTATIFKYPVAAEEHRFFRS